MFLFAIEATGESMDWIHIVFGNNIINYLILIVVLCWGWTKYATPAFAKRKEEIEASIKAAHDAKAESEKFLIEQKDRVAKAQDEQDKIVAEAKAVAEQLRAQSEEQTKKDLAALAAKVDAAIANERQVVITELRAAAVKAAIKLTEEQLKRSVSDSVKERLLNQFMEQLDAVSEDPGQKKMTAHQLETSH